MDPKERASQIRRAMDTLNETLKIAAQEGMLVELDILESNCVGFRNYSFVGLKTLAVHVGYLKGE